MRHWRWVALAAVLVGAGCGPSDGIKRAQIVGKLTAKGKPVENCSVVFVPAVGGMQGQGGIGNTDAQGGFTMVSSRAADTGVPPGEYKVILSRYVAADGTVLPRTAPPADYPGCVESVPPKYTDPATTPLRATVKQSGGEVVIDMPDDLLTIRGKR